MVQSNVKRSKESFKTKISSLNQSTQDGIIFTINNFENFSMEQYGKVDLIPELKKSNDDELYDVLQN